MSAKAADYAPVSGDSRVIAWLGEMGRDEAETKLAGKPAGTFLMRWSNGSGSYVLSYNFDGKNQVNHIGFIKPEAPTKISEAVVVQHENGTVARYENLYKYVDTMKLSGLIKFPLAAKALSPYDSEMNQKPIPIPQQPQPISPFRNGSPIVQSSLADDETGYAPLQNVEQVNAALRSSTGVTRAQPNPGLQQPQDHYVVIQNGLGSSTLTSSPTTSPKSPTTNPASPNRWTAAVTKVPSIMNHQLSANPPEDHYSSIGLLNRNGLGTSGGSTGTSPSNNGFNGNLSGNSSGNFNGQSSGNGAPHLAHISNNIGPSARSEIPPENHYASITTGMGNVSVNSNSTAPRPQSMAPSARPLSTQVQVVSDEGNYGTMPPMSSAPTPFSITKSPSAEKPKPPVQPQQPPESDYGTMPAIQSFTLKSSILQSQPTPTFNPNPNPTYQTNPNPTPVTTTTDYIDIPKEDMYSFMPGIPKAVDTSSYPTSTPVLAQSTKAPEIDSHYTTVNFGDPNRQSTVVSNDNTQSYGNLPPPPSSTTMSTLDECKSILGKMKENDAASLEFGIIYFDKKREFLSQMEPSVLLAAFGFSYQTFSQWGKKPDTKLHQITQELLNLVNKIVQQKEEAQLEAKNSSLIPMGRFMVPSKVLSGDQLWGKMKSGFELAKEANAKKAASLDFSVVRVEIEGSFGISNISCVLKSPKSSFWKSSSGTPAKEANKISWKHSAHSEVKIFEALTLEITQDNTSLIDVQLIPAAVVEIQKEGQQQAITVTFDVNTLTKAKVYVVHVTCSLPVLKKSGSGGFSLFKKKV